MRSAARFVVYLVQAFPANSTLGSDLEDVVALQEARTPARGPVPDSPTGTTRRAHCEEGLAGIRCNRSLCYASLRMHWSPRTVHAWLLVVCVALLATRIADGHLHLCFDGQEPPISLHAAVEAPHHGEDSAAHADRDVALSKAALAKSTPAGLDADALLFISVVWSLPLASVKHQLPVATPVISPSLLRLLRPPLRGPPTSLPA